MMLTRREKCSNLPFELSTAKVLS